ncbi:MAG: GHMP kinase [Actinomycetota bacterium]
MIVRSKAPLRISFCGGGTDVPPYPAEKGGVVLSATIDKYAYATLQSGPDTGIEITSLDYDVVVKYHTHDDLIYDGNLDLIKSIIRHFGIKEGLKLFLHSDAPPGSGLGSSSTLMVCLIGLFKHWQKLGLNNYEIAQLAYEIERLDLGILGGMQDQYAATFGGFNFIEFNGSSVVVNPLRISQDVLNELNYRLLLCYTGHTRRSAGILGRQIDAYVERQPSVVDALDKIKEHTITMKNALLTGSLDEFGEYLHVAWEEKQRLDKDIANDEIAGLYDAARKEGALGGKLLGAGGGGYLLIYCPFDKKHLIARKLESLGGQIIDFSFEHSGLQTWRVP